MKTGIGLPVAGLVEYAPVKTPVFSLASVRCTSERDSAYPRYAPIASCGDLKTVPGASGNRPFHASGVFGAQASAMIRSTSGCSGDRTMYVAPNTVSGRVVNTRIASEL